MTLANMLSLTINQAVIYDDKKLRNYQLCEVFVKFIAATKNYDFILG